MSLATGSLSRETPVRNAVIFVTPPHALSTLGAALGNFPSNFPAAIIIMLHPISGRERLVSEIRTANPRLMVMPGLDGAILRSNRAYLVYNSQHLAIGKENQLSSYFVDVVNSHIPLTGEGAGTVTRPEALLASLAERFGSRGVAIALADLDAREAEGFRRVQAAQGHTFAVEETDQGEDRMRLPRTAPAPATEVLPAHQIASRVLEILNRKGAAVTR